MNLSILLIFIIPTLVASVESTDTSNTKQQQLRKRTDAWTTYFEDEVYEKPEPEKRELGHWPSKDDGHSKSYSTSKSGKSGSRSSYSCSSSSSSGKSGKSCSSSSTRSSSKSGKSGSSRSSSHSSKSGKSGSSSRRLDDKLVNLRASLRDSVDSSTDEEERELHSGCKACLYDHMKMFKEKYRGHHWYSSSKSGKSGSRSYSCSSSSSSSGKSGKSCSSSSSSSSTRSTSKSGKSGSRSSSHYSTSKSGKSGSSSHRLRHK